jgi:alanyl aminopeptidase
MMKPVWAGLLTLAISAAAVVHADDTRTPPTLRLGDGATPLGYEATLAIDPQAETFTGEIRMRFRVNRALPVVWMNATRLTIESTDFRQGDRAVAVEVLPGGAEFVGFASTGAPFAPGEVSATIRYRGAVDPVSTRGLFRQREANDWYVVSQFEADSARRAFPCFDEPGWKTPWKLTLDAPAANVVVSNTRELSASDAPGRAGWKRHEFAATPPLPTYLVALAVGPFDVVDGGTAGRKNTPLRYLALRGRGAEMRFAKESTPGVLARLEDYFGAPYPFDKLDTVTIAQTVGFGAMENVGMITYAANLLHARPEEETITFRRRYVAIAAHEIAHQWYGNLVTPAWWDDIWLNEAFASWMGRKILAQYRPAWDTGWARNYGRSRALLADRLPSARRIHNPIVVKDDINTAFDRITYDKGSEVLSMFEAWLGPEQFRQGVRNYINARAYGTATSRDFFQAIGEAAGRGDAALAAFYAFVNQPGIPLLDTTLECVPGAPPRIVATQSRLQSAGIHVDEMRWTTPACFSYSDAGVVKKQCTEIRNGANAVKLEGAASCPQWAVGNAGGGGHYIARPDASLAARNLAGFDRIPAYEAVAMVNDASMLSRTGLMPPERALEIFNAALVHASASVRRAGAEGLRFAHPEHVVGPAIAAKAKADGTAVALAGKLGWGVKPGESEDEEELRVILLPYAARTDAGAGLRPEARTRALQWLRDRSGVDAIMVAPVLDTAARFADAATYDRLEAEALATKDLRERRQLQFALATVRDPGLRERAFGLTIARKDGAETMSGRDALQYLEEALEDDANRRAAVDFVAANFDALKAKVPPETGMNFAARPERLCTREDRERFAAFFGKRAGEFRGGQRKYALALESIDICVAATPR